MKTLHFYIRLLSVASRANISRHQLKSRHISSLLGVLFVIVCSISNIEAQTGGYFYVGNSSGEVWVFDQDFVYLHSISTGYPGGAVYGIDFLDNGSLVVTTWNQSGGRVIIYDPAGTVISAFSTPFGYCQVKSRNSDLLYTCSSSGVTEFTTSGTALRSFPTPGGGAIAVLPGDVLWISRHNAIDVFDLVSGELTTTITLDNGQSYAGAMTYNASTGTVLMCSDGAIYERTLEGAFVRNYTRISGIPCDNVTRGPNGDVYSSSIVYDYDYNGTLRFSRWNQSGAFLGVTDREGFSGELGNIVWAPYDNPGPQNNNSHPVLSSFPSSATVAEGGTYSFIATATDPDGDSLRFQILNSGGALIDPVTGVFSWTPTEWQGGGEYTFRISVIDDDIMFPMTDERSITIMVNDVNSAPVLGVIGNQTGSPRNNITFTATATDPDRPQNILTFSLIGAPAGAFINPSSGVFSWTPSRTQTGQFTFTVRVSDNGSPAMRDEQSVTVTVTNGRGR